MNPTTNQTIAPAADDGEGVNATNNAGTLAHAHIRATATQLRDCALLCIAARIDLDWQVQAEAALLSAIDVNGVATVDDARCLCPSPREPNWWCYIPTRLARRGVIIRTGQSTGRTPVTHGGMLRGWMRTGGGV